MNRAERLHDLIDRRGLGAVVLRRLANFAWYTAGADTRVDHVASEADLVIGSDGELVVTSTMEAPRMRAEQTPELEVDEYPWHEDRYAAVARHGRRPMGADIPIEGAADLSGEIADLRRTLDPDAVAKLRVVGRDATAAMHEAAAVIEPGITEHEAAAALAHACRRRGLSAPVLLAAADQRIAYHRHPLPFGATVERRAMLVASAERGGLYANLTHFVELEEPDRELARRLAACGEILARTREEATWPGRTLAEVFEDIKGFYADVGLPDEWRFHHQGGLTGYASRELIATPATRHRVDYGQVFAWNPSITGAKAEETFVLTDAGAEVLTGEPCVAVATP